VYKMMIGNVFKDIGPCASKANTDPMCYRVVTWMIQVALKGKQLYLSLVSLGVQVQFLKLIPSVLLFYILLKSKKVFS
jgi:hypothetical protein